MSKVSGLIKKMWGFSSSGVFTTPDVSEFSGNLESVEGRVSESLDETIGRCRSLGRYRRVTPSTITTSSSLILEKRKKAVQNVDVLNSTNGSVKRVLKDGCVYEGEWRKGKRTGKGKFTWPSGASYNGEFKSGKMEGYGTFIGADGDVYRGYWIGDKKEGFGQRKYANGDYYEGMWKKNVQDGEGRYVWTNGDEYKGECRNGVANGRGTLVRANGSKYEGEWENGVLKGSMNEDGVKVVAGEIGRRKSCEKVLPNICIWESESEAGDLTCDIVDNLEASMFYDDGLTALDLGRLTKSPCRRFFTTDEVKKPGVTVVKGHKNYELMLNLQLGIRYTIGKHASISRGLLPCDFEPKGKLWLRFPPEGSKITPPHQSTDFRWRDYYPVVFKRLRELFLVDPVDYMLSICDSTALRELSSPGKSGSLFYLTPDDKYILKTVKKSEVKVLVKMLPSYFMHMRKYDNTLLTKFFGLHCVKSANGQKVRFIVMGNLFYSKLPIHKRFDLKGSSHGRSIDKPEEEIDATTTLKDLDLNYMFQLQNTWFEELFKQLELDCGFLETEKIMDYSLLVGVHFRDQNAGGRIGFSPLRLLSGELNLHQNKVEGGFQDADLTAVSNMKMSMRLGYNMPARAERKSDNDDTGLIHFGEELHDVVLYFGIIDILQDYDITKKLENAYKSIQVDSSSISAVDPKLYSKRFQEFIKRIFILR